MRLVLELGPVRGLSRSLSLCISSLIAEAVLSSFIMVLLVRFVL